MNSSERRHFDALLEQVIDDLPEVVMDVLDTVPLVVDDYPSRKLLRELGIGPGEVLCGLHDGVPLAERAQDGPVDMPDKITIFRAGIIDHAAGTGEPTDEELRRQIRITILHEVGHHFGMTEEHLRELGYD